MAETIVGIPALLEIFEQLLFGIEMGHKNDHRPDY
jgi:hypothetical protein